MNNLMGVLMKKKSLNPLYLDVFNQFCISEVNSECDFLFFFYYFVSLNGHKAQEN